MPKTNTAKKVTFSIVSLTDTQRQSVESRAEQFGISKAAIMRQDIRAFLTLEPAQVETALSEKFENTAPFTNVYLDTVEAEKFSAMCKDHDVSVSQATRAAIEITLHK